MAAKKTTGPKSISPFNSRVARLPGWHFTTIKEIKDLIPAYYAHNPELLPELQQYSDAQVIGLALISFLNDMKNDAKKKSR